MAALKTRQTSASVAAFLRRIPDPSRQKDCRALVTLMKRVTSAEPRMWGTSIVGFGSYRYQGASGESEWFLTGFSPRKQDLTLYIMAGFDRHRDLLAALGRHKVGKSCLYLKRLADVDLRILRTLVTESVRHFKTRQR